MAAMVLVTRSQPLANDGDVYGVTLLRRAYIELIREAYLLDVRIKGPEVLLDPPVYVVWREMLPVVNEYVHLLVAR